MNREKWIRIVSMAVMIAAAAVLTYYFHAVLGSGRFFSHLFYIPIFLAALWWGWAGIPVPLLLGGLLVLGHAVYRPDLPPMNDYLRAAMFLVVAAMVVAIRGRILRAESALRGQAQELEKRVLERTEELVAVNRQLRQEIAQREAMAVSLRESERRYRLLFENANEAICITQKERIRFSNAALATLTGLPVAGLKDISFFDLVHPEDRPLVTDRYRRRMAGEEVPPAYAFRIRAAGEETRWVEISTVVIQWQGGPATLNFLRDITVRKRIEASASQIQKMEAVGALAGGIAHQFNNALSGITGHIDLLKLAFPDHPTATRYCESMLKSARSMAGLTQQLLAYARGGKYQPRSLSLTGLVRDVLPLMEATDDKRIRIETALSPQTPRVHADAVQMRMVLLAVINNGAEAIRKQAGRIRIETFDARIDPAAAEAFAGLPPGDYAGMSITDNGNGMAEEVRRRVFEPFFTTHFPGRGLGMAAAYGIVKNHGGYIYVDSEPGRGTTVHILLPPDSSPDAAAENGEPKSE